MSTPARARSRRFASDRRCCLGSTLPATSGPAGTGSLKPNRSAKSFGVQRAVSDSEGIWVRDVPEAVGLNDAWFPVNTSDLPANSSPLGKTGYVGDKLMEHRHVHPPAWPVAPGAVACGREPEDLTAALGSLKKRGRHRGMTPARGHLCPA